MKATRLSVFLPLVATAQLAAMHAAVPAYAQASRIKGIWIGAEEIASRPMSGAAWKALLKDANRDPGTADISNQDSRHDAYTLAAALVCARTGTRSYCDKATTGILSAIGTEFGSGARWLAAVRNIGAYVIAADLVGLRADGTGGSDGTRIENWIRGWLTVYLPGNTGGAPRPMRPFGGGSNADAHEGFAYAAIAAYLHDRMALDRAWDAFRTFVCDRDAPDRERIDLHLGVQYDWAHDRAKPCAVNPAGTTKVVPGGRPGAGGRYRIDGAVINDMRRGGRYQWPPVVTQYPWTGRAAWCLPRRSCSAPATPRSTPAIARCCARSSTSRTCRPRPATRSGSTDAAAARPCSW